MCFRGSDAVRATEAQSGGVETKEGTDVSVADGKEERAVWLREPRILN
jgi:hypothetical protein